MPRGRTRSTLTLSERREKAFRRFTQGWTNTDIARELGVTDETVKRYREEYREEIEQAARDNPQLLIRVIDNTIETLRELDLLRQTAWEEYEEAESPQVRTTILNTLAKVGRQKAELFGLFGVRQEFFLHVQRVEQLQQEIISFLQRELCNDDRDKFMAFMEVQQAAFGGMVRALPAIEARALPGPDDQPVRTRRGQSA